MINLIYVYCYWLWFVSLLYFLDIIKYSPLINLIFGFIYTLFSNIFYYKAHYSKKIFIVLWEFLILYIIFTKSKKMDIIFNILLFITYYIFIRVNGYTFKKIYFTEISNIHNNNDNLFQYIKKRLNI